MVISLEYLIHQMEILNQKLEHRTREMERELQATAYRLSVTNMILQDRAERGLQDTERV